MPLLIDFLKSNDPRLNGFLLAAKEAMWKTTLDRYVNAFDEQKDPINIIPHVQTLASEFLALIQSVKLDPMMMKAEDNGADLEVALLLGDEIRVDNFINKILMMACDELLDASGNLKKEIIDAFDLKSVAKEMLKPKGAFVNYLPVIKTVSVLLNRDPEEEKTDFTDMIQIVLRNEFIKGYFSQVNMVITQGVGNKIADWVGEKDENKFIYRCVVGLFNTRSQYLLNLQSAVNRFKEFTQYVPLDRPQVVDRIIQDNLFYQISDMPTYFLTQQVNMLHAIHPLLLELPEAKGVDDYKAQMLENIASLENEFFMLDKNEERIKEIVQTMKVKTDAFEKSLMTGAFFKTPQSSIIGSIKERLNEVIELRERIVKISAPGLKNT